MNIYSQLYWGSLDESLNGNFLHTEVTVRKGTSQRDYSALSKRRLKLNQATQNQAKNMTVFLLAV